MIVRFALVAAGVMLAALSASAQTFPSKNIHIVVAYAPGGTGDIVARLIAPQLGAALGQTVVIENRAGATGAIGTQAVVSAPRPTATPCCWGRPARFPSTSTGSRSCLRRAEGPRPGRARFGRAACARRARQGAVFDRLAIWRKRCADRKPLTFASAGTGTPGHFAGEFLKLRAKASLTHVPYKGAGPGAQRPDRRSCRHVFLRAFRRRRRCSRPAP